MTRSELYEELSNINATRESRGQMAQMVLNQPAMVQPLLEIVFDVDDPVSVKACWVLEFAFKEELRLLDDYLNIFIEKIPALHQDSGVRPIAKICEILILEYYTSKGSKLSSGLTERQREKIAEICFDWLIGPFKVATKAYSMTCLYHLGKSFDWIHPELRLVLEQNYPDESAAYKARARHVLAKLRK